MNALADELHPAQPDLAAYVRGELDATADREIEAHLEQCERCCRTLGQLSSDTMVALLRRPPPATPDTKGAASSGDQQTLLHLSRGATTPPREGATRVEATPARNWQESLPDELARHNKYEILSLLGQGGMGNVYKAQHRLMNRVVALKVINQQLVRSEKAARRFQREVRAAAQLAHPHIVTAYDAEQAGNLHFLVMEYVDGVDLAEVLRSRGPLPVAEACEYIRQAALGLQHAHETGMVHRDIKPQNLMLSGLRNAESESRNDTVAQASQTAVSQTAIRQPKSAIVKILDFGLAQLAAEPIEDSSPDENPTNRQGAPHLTLTGAMMGTPDYIAPEQARDAHSADIRADIYSLGCTLYCLLSGAPPFPTGTPLERALAHAEREPRPLRDVCEHLPAGVEDVVRRMMAKRPDDRFQSPAEVAAALAPYAVAFADRTAGISPSSVQHPPKPGLQQPSKLPPSRLPLLPLALAGTILLGLLVSLAAVLVVVTDRGRLVINSEVDDVQVRVKQGTDEVTILDVKTGSQVIWLKSGKYQVEFVGNQNGLVIKDGGFELSRLGTAIVTATWDSAGSGAIRSFSTADKTISQDRVAVDDGGWKITADDTRTARLFEIHDPNLAEGRFFYRAKLKTENVKGRAYLEMWVRVPGQGESFSKGFHNALIGTNDWAEYEIPFLLKKGEHPDLVKLNLSIEGTGTVWMKDIALVGRTLAPVAGSPPGTTAPPTPDAAAPPRRPTTPAPRPSSTLGQNLIADPSLEDTALGELYPTGWGKGNQIPPKAYQHQVVAGGRTGKHGWKIEGDGQYAVIPTNRPPAHSAYRYVARAWVQIEAGSAQIKLLYFGANGTYLGENRGTVTAPQDGWQRLTMIDDLARYPEARYLSLAPTLIGKGQAVFDDLELIAFDANKLPQNFETEYGAVAANQSAVLARGVGCWETTLEYKPTLGNADGRTLKGATKSRLVFDDQCLLSHFLEDDETEESLGLLMFDANLGAYRYWIFMSTGQTYERIGPWDAKSQTLSLNLKPPSPGVTGHSTQRFVTPERIEGTLLVKGADGQVTRDVRCTSIRKVDEAADDMPTAGGPAKTPPELALLDKLAGNWSMRSTEKPSVGLPEGKVETFSEQVEWILEGRFLLFRAYDDKKQMRSLGVMSYDPNEKTYLYRHFAKDVYGGQWRITWDESSRGFHWRSIDMPVGWIGTGFVRWVDNDTFDNQALIKDEQGRVLLDSRQAKTRVK